MLLPQHQIRCRMLVGTVAALEFEQVGTGHGGMKGT